MIEPVRRAQVALLHTGAWCCARPTGSRHGLTAADYTQRFKEAKRRAAPKEGVQKKRGQGHYRGRSPKAPPEVLEELR
jgi:hypothetical protein